jgi:hypothetical protein
MVFRSKLHALLAAPKLLRRRVLFAFHWGDDFLSNFFLDIIFGFSL